MKKRKNEAKLLIIILVIISVSSIIMHDSPQNSISVSDDIDKDEIKEPVDLNIEASGDIQEYEVQILDNYNFVDTSAWTITTDHNNPPEWSAEITGGFLTGEIKDGVYNDRYLEMTAYQWVDWDTFVDQDLYEIYDAAIETWIGVDYNGISTGFDHPNSYIAAWTYIDYYQAYGDENPQTNSAVDSDYMSAFDPEYSPVEYSAYYSNATEIDYSTGGTEIYDYLLNSASSSIRFDIKIMHVSCGIGTPYDHFWSLVGSCQLTLFYRDLDNDNDGLTNAEEDLLGTDMNDEDSDDDGLLDGEEVETYNTDPLDDDSDNDLLNDYEEVNLGIDNEITNPNDPDSDDDLLTDYWEWGNSTDPNDPDSDNDLLTDYWEWGNSTNPNDPDCDDDLSLDYWEIQNGTDPWDPDSDDDNMPDGWEISNELDPLDYLDNETDNDLDLLLNIYEYGNSTNPNNPDCDNDLSLDYWEIQNGTDPWDPDSDNDLLTDYWEWGNSTDPNDPDSDDDLLTDYWEWGNSTDPNDPDSDNDLL
ncbi:MAG: hypothetical protein GF364_22320, partial [Candidatus Lokiarchaeota archaeon]|nr:hypothetical protein [Candidatus Lokiarchaeota archaeon]